MQEETDQKATIGPFYWDKLSQLHPTDVCNRTEALYNPTKEGFLLPVYNLRYLILPKAKKILGVNPVRNSSGALNPAGIIVKSNPAAEQRGIISNGVKRNDQPVEEELPPFFYLMVLCYLTEAKETKPTHTWVSEKDLKGGSTFFRGPHSLQVGELEDFYGKNPDAFLKAGRKLGGSEILYGDKGFALEVFPKVPLAYILWKGDEEFPPKIGLLFDSTIEFHLPLDIIWCMVAETSRRLTEHPSS
jgi:hypothetical protein